MNGKIIIYSTDVHRDAGKAKLGEMAAAEALGVKCDCHLSSAWLIFIERSDRAAFLELAREEVKMPRLSNEEWEEYCQKADALRERGVQVGDILVCDEGARPKPHEYTGKLHVRISEYCLIDGTGPRFFVHGFQRGLVAYVLGVTDETQMIAPETKLRVVEKFKSSVVLEKCDVSN